MKGTLFIISAPSGAGKTSLIKAFLPKMDHISVSVSHTTRKMRPGEVDGQDYHFIDKVTFEQKIVANVFFEYALVFGNYYGTSSESVVSKLADGEDIILEIDWQGAQQVKRITPQSVSIFILPPSKKALLERLQARGQDKQEIIEQRMLEVSAAVSHQQEFDYLVVNDRFDKACDDLQSIIKAHRLLQKTQAQRWQRMLSDLTLH